MGTANVRGRRQRQSREAQERHVARVKTARHAPYNAAVPRGAQLCQLSTLFLGSERLQLRTSCKEVQVVCRVKKALLRSSIPDAESLLTHRRTIISHRHGLPSRALVNVKHTCPSSQPRHFRFPLILPSLCCRAEARPCALICASSALRQLLLIHSVARAFYCRRFDLGSFAWPNVHPPGLAPTRQELLSSSVN